MKTTKNIAKISLNFLIILTMTFSLAFLSSCNKTDETLDLTAEEALLKVQDETLATDLFDEIIEIGEEAEARTENTNKSTEVGIPYYRLSNCAIVTRVVDYTARTISVIIDFGEENCEGPDGKFRRGKIIIERSGFYWHGVVTATYTFDNYFVNDNQLTGGKTYTGAFNEDLTYTSTFTAQGEIILANEAGIITWNSTRTRNITEGADTWGFADNRVEVTGSSYGTTSDGTAFSFEIIEPLVRIYQEGCFRHYVAGIIEISKANGTEISINYGDGTCDKFAEVTIDGVTRIIELGKRWHLGAK